MRDDPPVSFACGLVAFMLLLCVHFRTYQADIALGLAACDPVSARPAFMALRSG